jgi:hypothetical protein
LPPFLDMVERAEITPSQQGQRRASEESKVGRAPSARYEVVASCVVRGGVIDSGRPDRFLGCPRCVRRPARQPRREPIVVEVQA